MFNLTQIRSFRSAALLSLVTALVSVNAQAYKGSISFNEQDKAAHLKTLPVVVKTAAGCLKEHIKHHQEFFATYGISPFYGSNSAYKKMTAEQKRAYLISLGQPNDGRYLTQMIDYLTGTSCVGLTVKCLKAGFVAGGQQALWKTLSAYTELNDYDGGALQDGLQKLGWKILYWNADVSQNKKWDKQEAAKKPGQVDPFRGYHESNWQAVNNQGTYYQKNNKVDDKTSLVNFGAQVPEAIKSVPFFVGTAHMGYHVFPGTFGQVIEAHSTRALNDPKTLESAPFNPLGGGGPTEGEYRSGLIAVPPGTVN